MLTTERFPLQPGPNVVLMPAGSEVLAVQFHRYVPCLWAKVDTSRPSEPRVFQTFETGAELPDDPRVVHIGTFHQDNGALVWHVFELPVETPAA